MLMRIEPCFRQICKLTLFNLTEICYCLQECCKRYIDTFYPNLLDKSYEICKIYKDCYNSSAAVLAK